MVKKSGPKRSVGIGIQLARDVLVQRAAASRQRAKALAAQGQPAGRARKGVRAVTAAAAHPGILVAEGDSWFDYPFHDVLSELEDRHGFDVEKVAHRGDTVEDMAYSGSQLTDFARLVEKVMRRGTPPKAILLSGGGNDVAGDEFPIMLNHAASGIRGLNEKLMSGVIDDRLFDAYTTILAAIKEVSRRVVGHAVPVVVHGYAYAVPDGRGYAGGFGPLPGPWLEPGFRRKGYPFGDERSKLVRVLIDRLNAMLQRLVALPEFAHVEYLDLRPMLPSGAGYKMWWANELHPTKRGFETVADLFATKISQFA